jgi:hypothetical protein
MWRARFGRGFGPVVRQSTKSMNELLLLLLLLLFNNTPSVKYA